MQKRLYLFIEGEWDRIFFETFLHDYLCDTYNFDEVSYVEFAEDSNARLELQKLIGRGKVNFLLCPDLDEKFNKDKRIEKIKKLAAEEFKVDYEEIKSKSFVIIQEIESWYLAGFNESFCTKKGILFYPDTADTNKGTFNKIAKQRKKTPLIFRDELTKTYRNNYSIEEAKERNESFRKFLEKVLIQVKRLS